MRSSCAPHRVLHGVNEGTSRPTASDCAERSSSARPHMMLERCFRGEALVWGRAATLDCQGVHTQDRLCCTPLKVLCCHLYWPLSCCKPLPQPFTMQLQGDICCRPLTAISFALLGKAREDFSPQDVTSAVPRVTYLRRGVPFVQGTHLDVGNAQQQAGDGEGVQVKATAEAGHRVHHRKEVVQARSPGVIGSRKHPRLQAWQNSGKYRGAQPLTGACTTKTCACSAMLSRL